MPYLIMNCYSCHKEFTGGVFKCRTSKYCSKQCAHIGFKIKRSLKECNTCKKEFLILPSQRKGKYCSTKCIRPIHKIDKFDCGKARRFWSIATEEEKIKRLTHLYENLITKHDNKCWILNKVPSKNGYVHFNMGRNKYILAHRLSWIIHRGNIPDNLMILHKCDNPPCTNPDHLFIGTHADNVKDKINKKRHNASHGSSHYNAKLNDDMVLKIKKLIKEGYSQSAIAHKFEVRPSTIQNIADGKTWKHVKELDAISTTTD